MKWKNLPYWLKGGFFGLLFILFIQILVSNFPDNIVSRLFAFYIIFTFWYVLRIPVFDIDISHLSNLGLFYVKMSFILIYIFHFLIGAVIGLIYGKVKLKK